MIRGPLNAGWAACLVAWFVLGRLWLSVPATGDDRGADGDDRRAVVAANDELADDDGGAADVGLAVVAGDLDDGDDSLSASAETAETPRRWTDGDVRAALVGRSLVVRRIVFCEVGRSGVYDPYAVGSLGEQGPAQLLPGCCSGLAIFYRWGYTEPNNPWQAVSFIEDVESGRDRVSLASQYPRTSRGCVGSP